MRVGEVSLELYLRPSGTWNVRALKNLELLVSIRSRCLFIYLAVIPEGPTRGRKVVLGPRSAESKG